MKLPPKKRTIYFFSIMMVVTTITYLNHFDNAFHFDDIHTIVENPNIRSLKNIPSFFVDGSTISSLPQNQSYRPVVATSLAIDYWLGKGYSLFYFHLLTFILFLILGLLLFLISFKILEQSAANESNVYIAAAISLGYMLHPVMAETVNYIIARSDLQATFFVVLALFCYQYWEFGKKYHLYLVPFIIGTLAKPIAIMLVPIFFCYILLFEYNLSFTDLFKKKSFSTVFQIAKKCFPMIITGIILYVLIIKMTPETYATGSSSTFQYAITQPLVIAHYIGSIFLPIHLSADTDWSLLDSIWSWEFFLGLCIMGSLIAIAFITSKTKKLYPIAFGIAWFFLALVPTSSIIPLAEVTNDHRMFFPYIGLVIATGYSFYILVNWLRKRYDIQNSYIIGVLLLIFALCAYGTYQRNEVWDNDESLWEDVTIKSPKNGRGLMQYGLTKMSKGDYNSAENYFMEALQYTPKYHTLHINLGILNEAQGKKEEAEDYFKKAVNLSRKNFSTWFYYGRFLSKNNRKQEAIEKLSKSLTLSPSHIPTRQLLMKNYLDQEEWDRLNELAYSTTQLDPENKEAQSFLLASIQRIGKLDMIEQEIANNPTADKYINLGLSYFNKQQYLKCIEASQKALALKPDSHIAYNNICISHTLLGNFDKAIDACNRALEVQADFKLAKNNLKKAIANKAEIERQLEGIKKEATEANYLNLSLLYYKYNLYKKCIETATEGIGLFPKSDNLYNNICAAHNSLKQWDKAIAAGKKGLEINPDNQLLKNNYTMAIKNQQLNK